MTPERVFSGGSVPEKATEPDRHLFTGVRKQTLYLQEAVGA